jgi:phosphoserine phosphatase RsbU/P
LSVSELSQSASYISNLPRWLRPRAVRRIWGVLVFGVLVVSGAVIAHQWLALERSHIGRASLYARVLADHADRTMASTEVAMGSLVEYLADESPETDTVRIESRLARSLSGLPFVRSLSVVDAKRRVVASSDTRNQGATLGPEHRMVQGSPEALMWGTLRAARDLADTASQQSKADGYLPVAMSYHGPNSQQYYLLATLNMAYFRNQHGLLMQGEPLAALMSSYEGGVLTQSEDLAVPVGISIKESWIFKQFLPAQESGHTVGPDLDGLKAIQAFRVARRYPLILVIQEPYPVLLAELRDSSKGVLLAAAFALMLLTMLSILARRSLSAHHSMTTNMMQVNRELIASETRRWALMEAAVDAVVTIDEGGRVLEFNAAAEKMFGYKRDALLGQAMHDFIVPDRFRSAHVNGMQRYLETGEGPVLNRRIEITAIRAGGEEFPVELTIVPAKVTGGVYFAATIRDITQRIKSENERNELMTRFQATALDLSMQKLAMDQHAIVVIADDQHKVRFANNKFLEVSGLTLDEVNGRLLQEVICSGAGQEELFKEMVKTITAGDIWNGELMNRTKTGTAFWFSSTIVPVPGDDGHPREYISVHSDVTRLKLAELEAASIRARELLIGSRIQKSLLVNPPSVHNPCIWVSSSSQASQGIDGDFVDVIPMGPDCVDIVLADVMGKGIPAALMGAATKMQLSRLIAVLLADRRRNGRLPSPAEIISTLHAVMAPHLQALEAFVTMTYIRVDSRHHRITWVGCGHEEPVLICPDGKRKILRNQHAPIGVLDLDVCDQDSSPIRPGDSIFLCSDGVTDAVMADGSKLGNERLMEMLDRLSSIHPTPASVLHSLRGEILHPGATLTDDATMMYVMLRHDEPRVMCYELPVDLVGIEQVRKVLHEQAVTAGIEPESLGLYTVACVEAFTNIVRHAKGMPVDAPIEMLLKVLDDVFEVRFVYLGETFDPPQVKMDVEWSEFPEGGIGLTIIHSACEQVQYSSDNGRNTTRLRSYPSVRSNLYPKP